jgi:TATA-binding protein-associated factor Taf7
MAYKLREWTESLDHTPSSDLEFQEPVHEREEAEYKTESVEELPQWDFDRPAIGHAFLQDELVVVQEKLKTINQAIQKNYVMQKNYVTEVDEEIGQDQGELNAMRQLNFQTSKILADRLRSLETGIQNSRRKKRETKEHFTDKIFHLKLDLLEVLPEYQSLMRLWGVLGGRDKRTL